MIKYIITKAGKEYRSYTDTHSEIMSVNHLSFNQIAQEGIIDRGIKFIVSNNEALPDNLLRARIVESIYSYGYIRQGD